MNAQTNKNTQPSTATPEKVLSENENVTGIVKPVDFSQVDKSDTTESENGDSKEPEKTDEAKEDVELLPPKAKDVPKAEAVAKAVPGARKVKLLKQAYLNSQLYDAGKVLDWVGPLAGHFMVEI